VERIISSSIWQECSLNLDAYDFSSGDKVYKSNFQKEVTKTANIPNKPLLVVQSKSKRRGTAFSTPVICELLTISYQSVGKICLCLSVGAAPTGRCKFVNKGMNLPTYI
jgi:hypothetical protein